MPTITPDCKRLARMAIMEALASDLSYTYEAAEELAFKAEKGQVNSEELAREFEEKAEKAASFRDKEPLMAAAYAVRFLDQHRDTETAEDRVKEACKALDLDAGVVLVSLDHSAKQEADLYRHLAARALDYNAMLWYGKLAEACAEYAR